jgi:hypothetical protein
MPTDSTARTRTPAGVVVRRLGVVALAIVVAGAIVAGVVVAVDVVGLAGWRGGAAADTAKALRTAAAAADRLGDPEVAPGQYRRITTHAVTLSTVDDGDGVRSWLEGTTEHQYVPADLAGDWVWVRPLPAPIRGFGDGVLAYAEQYHADLLAQSPDGDGIVRAAGGAFYGAGPDWGPEQLAALPTDPRRLLNEVYSTQTDSGLGPDATAFRFLLDRLTSGYATGAERAAMFRALELIPGTKTAADRASWDGRTGIVVERDEGELRDQLLIDPDRGVAIGQRQIRMQRLGAIRPGTATGWTSVVVDVVDSAPAGGTVCGTGTGMTLVDGQCLG